METKKNSKKSKSSTKSNLKENISQIDSELLEIRKRIYLFEKNIHSKETSPPNPKPSPNTSIKPNPIVHLNYTYQNYPLSYENNSCQTEKEVILYAAALSCGRHAEPGFRGPDHLYGLP